MEVDADYQTRPVGDGFREISVGETIERGDELLEQFSGGSYKAGWVPIHPEFRMVGLTCGDIRGSISGVLFRFRRKVAS